MSDPKNDAANPSPAPPAKPAARLRGKPTGWRKWAYRLAAMTLVPALLLGVLELSLRIAGFGHPTDFFLDGTRTEGPGMCVDNPDFGRWVFPGSLERPPQPIPFAFAAVKPANTYRVFVLGESAAMGFPDPSFSFARVLEVMLRAAYPEKRIEVINTAMVAINSHVVLPIARQCVQRDPDLIVVHLGNNEVVGPFGAAGVLGPYSPSRGVIHAHLAARTTRTGQLLDRLVQWLRPAGKSPRAWEGMAMFRNSHVPAGDSRLVSIHAQFRENLEDICRAGADAGVPVIVCTVPVNLQDCPPFASLHALGLAPERLDAWEKRYKEGVRLEGQKQFAEAARHYEEAAGVDDQFAELAFRRGRCAAALGKPAEAAGHFAQARDLDALRFRSDADINAAIRAVAGAVDGTHLADAERAFAEDSPTGVPGEECFLEHVHMNFHGNYLLARTVFQTLMRLAPRAPGSPAADMPPLEPACAELLGYTEWAEFNTKSYIQKMFEKSPFADQLDHAERNARWKARVNALQTGLQKGGLKQALTRAEKAVQTAENDWMLRMNYGQLLTTSGDLWAAEEQFEAVLKSLRHSFAAHCKLGDIALKTGRTSAALDQYRQALQLSPDCSEATYGLARALAADGKIDEACALFEREVEKEPDRAGALVGLGVFLDRHGKPKEARARFQEALKLDPNHAPAHLRLGDLALKQGDPTAAREQYEAALRLRPEYPEAHDRLAKLRKGADGRK